MTLRRTLHISSTSLRRANVIFSSVSNQCQAGTHFFQFSLSVTTATTWSMQLRGTPRCMQLRQQTNKQRKALSKQLIITGQSIPKSKDVLVSFDSTMYIVQVELQHPTTVVAIRSPLLSYLYLQLWLSTKSFKCLTKCNTGSNREPVHHTGFYLLFH